MRELACSAATTAGAMNANFSPVPMKRRLLRTGVSLFSISLDKVVPPSSNSRGPRKAPYLYVTQESCLGHGQIGTSPS